MLRSRGSLDGYRRPGELFAYALYTAFLLANYLLPGPIAVVTAIASLVGAGAAVIAHRRSFPSWHEHVSGVALLLLLAAVTIRFLIPPYGEPGFHGAGATRVALLLGFYALILSAYQNVPFERLLRTLAIIGSIAAAIAVASFLRQGDFTDRIEFLGRSAHPIMGAGAIAASLAAVIVLLRGRSRGTYLTLALVAMAATLATALYLSGSRGPMVSFLLAVLLAPFLAQRRSLMPLFLCGLCVWASVSLLALLDGYIQAALCPITSLACRPSNRPETWATALRVIADHPLLGVGYRYRFPDIPHTHNAYLGLALHFGIPVLVAFVAFSAACARDIVRMASADERSFVIMMYIFANGFMGTDLNDPFRFLNSHYLFLWLPLFLATIARKRTSDVTPAPVRTVSNPAFGEAPTSAENRIGSAARSRDA